MRFLRECLTFSETRGCQGLRVEASLAWWCRAAKLKSVRVSEDAVGSTSVQCARGQFIHKVRLKYACLAAHRHAPMSGVPSVDLEHGRGMRVL